MSAPVRFLFRGQTLWLSSARCIFWEEESLLILSDLHFGKSGHFRKSGIGIPQPVYQEDLHRLFAAIQFFKPGNLLIAGDMFHSVENKEVDFFAKWRKDIPEVAFSLIRGNHDILAPASYKKAGIRVFENSLQIKNFCFTHDIASASYKRKGLFTFSGHIHPGVRIQGMANQSVMLPCFYFGKSHAVLPAFSSFTGLARMRPEVKDHVFVLTEDAVIKVQ